MGEGADGVHLAKREGGIVQEGERESLDKADAFWTDRTMADDPHGQSI